MKSAVVSGSELDPFIILNLPHDPAVTDTEVRRAFRFRLRRVRPGAGRAGDSARVTALYAALRSAGQRRRMLVDLALEPDHWRGGDLPESAEMVRTEVPSPEGPWDLETAWDRSALARATGQRCGWSARRLGSPASRRQPWYGRPGSLAARVLLTAAVPLLAQLVTRVPRRCRGWRLGRLPGRH